MFHHLTARIGRHGRRNERVGAVTSALALVLPLAACVADGGPPSRATLRDSAGITIVENIPPDDSARNVWWTVEPTDFDIGTADASDEYALYRVADAARLSDGRIVVANGSSVDLRYYDEHGVFLRRSGRQGGGPGEFQGIGAIEVDAADSVRVIDFLTRRISVLAPDGEFVRDIAIVTAAGRLLARLADGHWLATVSVRQVSPGDIASMQDRITRSPGMLVRWQEGAGTTDTIVDTPGGESMIHVDSNGSQITRVMVSTPLFAKSPSYAVASDGVWMATQDAAEIRFHGFDGTLRRIVRTGRTVEPVTDEHLDAAFRRRVEQMPEPARAQAIADGPGNTPHGDYVPPYGSVLTDRVGNLWVADYDDPTAIPGRFTVYAADGAVLARIALPSRFRPYDIGEDWILGRNQDDLDVEHVQRLRIVRP